MKTYLRFFGIAVIIALLVSALSLTGCEQPADSSQSSNNGDDCDCNGVAEDCECDDCDCETCEEEASAAAHAGTDQTHTLAHDLTVILDGTDSAGDIASYSWDCVSYTADQGQVYVPYSAAEVTALIVDADTAEAAVDVRKAGTYVFRLTVTDSAGKTATDNLTVKVESYTTAPATIKITGRDFSSFTTELNLGIEDYCSFEGEHEEFTEADFEKIAFNFFSGSYDGPGSADRSTDDLDRYVDDGIIQASEYGNNDFPQITQTFYYDNKPDAVGFRSFWIYTGASRFYELYDGEPDWNTLSAIPTAALTLSKQVTDLADSTATVTGITIVSPPAKTIYDAGESLDFTGLVVRASYSNNTTQIVEIGRNHVRGFNNQAQETQTVTITFGGQTATFNVSVNTISVSGVSLNKTELALTVRNSEKLTAAIQPANAKNKEVSWKSSNTDIAAVDQNGTVTAIVPGTVTITVTTADGGQTAECNVTVNAGTITVTFNSMGGSAVPSQILVDEGGIVMAAIPQATPTNAGYGIFDNWYSDEGRTVLFDFNTPITANITLYANWNAHYNLGDTGPGGGIIFYRSNVGFTMTDNDETCHYLEAAPADMPTTLTWASSSYANTSIADTGTAIGTGRMNTALILATDADAPAAKACTDYSSGGKTDWFLPSWYELTQLHINGIFIGNLGSARYWSSSQDSAISAFAQAPSESGGVGTSNKTLSPSLVRAIRAF